MKLVQRAEQEAAPAYWDPAAFYCLCSFPPPYTLERESRGIPATELNKTGMLERWERRHLS